jgi:hypothetical protein
MSVLISISSVHNVWVSSILMLFWKKYIYTVCRFLMNSSFKPQFEAIKYTTNQTYKLFSISKIVSIGTTSINFLLLIDHYWGPGT